MNEFEIEFDIKPNEFEIDLENVIKEVYPQLENLEVTPTSSEQVFNHPDSYGYDEVVVNAVETEKLNITPTKETQSFNGMYNKVEVEAVTSEIDSNIVADNIRNDVEILGVTGNFIGSKYAPRTEITFKNYNGEELDNETQLLDTTYQTTFYNMFGQCTNLKELKLNQWDTSKVTNMSMCFKYTQNLELLEVSNWDTSNVTNMSQIFYRSEKLPNLDLSSWNTSKVTTMREMFYHCDSLKKLDIRNFTFGTVTDSFNMFQYIPNDCEIIVKSDVEKQWVLNVKSTLTNIKTVAEL